MRVCGDSVKASHSAGKADDCIFIPFWVLHPYRHFRYEWLMILRIWTGQRHLHAYHVCTSLTSLTSQIAECRSVSKGSFHALECAPATVCASVHQSMFRKWPEQKSKWIHRLQVERP
jgi:hypothetical protein